MDLKISQSNLQIPDNPKETLLQKARKFQGNDGKIDENEMMELVADAEKGGMNQDEQEFLAALMDKGVAQEIVKSNFEPTEMHFQVDASQHATHQADLNTLRSKLHTDPGLATKAVKSNQDANAKRLDDLVKAKTATAVDQLDAQVQKNGAINKDYSHYNGKEEKKLQKKANDKAGLSSGANHCAATVGYFFYGQGFKHPAHMGSTDKAVAFFVYKHFTAAPGKGQNPQFAAQQKADEANGTGRKLFLLKDGADAKMKTYMKAAHPSFDADKNSFDWKNLPIRKGDMVFMNPKSASPYGPEHAAVVKDYDPATGRMVLIQANPLAESTYDLSQKADRDKFMGFGRPSASDFD